MNCKNIPLCQGLGFTFMNKQKIYWTSIALDSLIEVERYIRIFWDEKVVRNFLKSIDVVIEIIRDNPQIAPKIEKTEFRKFVVHKNVSLLYVNENEYSKVL